MYLDTRHMLNRRRFCKSTDISPTACRIQLTPSWTAKCPFRCRSVSRGRTLPWTFHSVPFRSVPFLSDLPAWVLRHCQHSTQSCSLTIFLPPNKSQSWCRHPPDLLGNTMPHFSSLFYSYQSTSTNITHQTSFSVQIQTLQQRANYRANLPPWHNVMIMDPFFWIIPNLQLLSKLMSLQAHNPTGVPDLEIIYLDNRRNTYHALGTTRRMMIRPPKKASNKIK